MLNVCKWHVPVINLAVKSLVVKEVFFFFFLSLWNDCRCFVTQLNRTLLPGAACVQPGTHKLPEESARRRRRVVNYGTDMRRGGTRTLAPCGGGGKRGQRESHFLQAYAISSAGGGGGGGGLVPGIKQSGE